MKTIGLIGGMSWESTAHYYSAINRGINARLGGHHSAKLVMVSVDFAEIEQLQRQDRWQEAGVRLAHAALQLQAAGAQCVAIATNTMHKVAEQVAAATALPLLHIADATGLALQQAGHQQVALLGTAFTMRQDFYKGRLADRFQLQVLTPDEAQQSLIHRVIYEELCLGQVRDDSRQQFVQIIDQLQQRGATAVILGCTEIGMLIQPQHSPLPCFDTTALHANALVDFALQSP